MELNSISNNVGVDSMLNINSDKLNAVSNKLPDITNHDVKSDVVSLDSNTKSDFTVLLNKDLSKVSDIQSLQNSVADQHNTISKLQYAVEYELSSKDADTKVTSLIESYNSSAKVIYSNLNDMVEDINSDSSSTYFDGVLGSKPLSANDISEAIQKKQEQLKAVSQKLDDEMTKVVDQSYKVILKEKEVSSEQSPFKNVDFGKESSDFSSNNLHAISTNISMAHTNPLQSHSIRLLS